MKHMKKQNHILLSLMVCGALAGCGQQAETEVPPPEEPSFEERVKQAASEFHESAKEVADEIGEEMKELGGYINEGSKNAAQEMKKFGGDVSDAFDNAMDEMGE